MKLHHLRFYLAFVFLFGAGCTRPPTDGGADNGTDGSPADREGTVYVRFTNGSVTLDAVTESDGNAQTTKIRSGNETLLQMRTSLPSMQIMFPTESDVPTEIPFDPPLETPPSEYALNRLATMIAGDVFGESGSLSRLQEIPDCVRRNRPGCDFFPDARCTLRCCADHDRCYFEHECCATSWLPFLGSAWCKSCNGVVILCIIDTCREGGEGDPNTEVCFDSACGMSYTCPEFNCNCGSPCRWSPTCGNGSCEIGENADNCPSDCPPFDGGDGDGDGGGGGSVTRWFESWATAVFGPKEDGQIFGADTGSWEVGSSGLRRGGTVEIEEAALVLVSSVINASGGQTAEALVWQANGFGAIPVTEDTRISGYFNCDVYFPNPGDLSGKETAVAEIKLVVGGLLLLYRHEKSVVFDPYGLRGDPFFISDYFDRSIFDDLVTKHGDQFLDMYYTPDFPDLSSIHMIMIHTEADPRANFPPMSPVGAVLAEIACYVDDLRIFERPR